MAKRQLHDALTPEDFVDLARDKVLYAIIPVIVDELLSDAGRAILKALPRSDSRDAG